jgi:succinate dehydrogenase/fumarate reductase flavoprotein subunit
MKVKDYHELARCLDAESMALGAEMFYRASLMRTESRGFHYRGDYPEMDNKNWLKWIILKNDNGKMKLYTEDIPIHKYPYKPLNA